MKKEPRGGRIPLAVEGRETEIRTAGASSVNGRDRHSSVRRERPSREEAEAAVRMLIRYAGDDPNREGLRDTPRRVIEAYAEFFAGYNQDPVEISHARSKKCTATTIW